MNEKVILIIAECKDKGPFIEEDIENLRKVADAFPVDRFYVYILLSQLAPFTEEEVNLASTLNDRYRQRAILLSTDELEPFYIGEADTRPEASRRDWSSPAAMARTTAKIYFPREDY